MTESDVVRTPLSPTPRSTVTRQRARATTERDALDAILDAGLICHLGVLLDGAPVVLPTTYGRDGNLLYLHGSTGAGNLRAALTGPVSVAVTHLDGIVYARSAMGRQPESVEAYFAEVSLARGGNHYLDDAIDRIGKELTDLSDIEYRARRVVELMALVLQGAQLVRHGHAAVADAFCATRFGGDWGIAFGTLPTGADTAAILERAHV